MELNNFKELLLKKSEDNQNLQVLIKYMRNEYLVDHVMESLEKMAASYSKKNPNHAVMHFGTHMDEGTEGEMFHDSLSHHASHYKSALDAGNNKVADQHMGQVFKMMHMGDKLTRDGLNDHSHGKLRIEAVDPKPWERAKYATQNDQGKFKTDTKGWGRQGANPNYDFLRSSPHESYKDEVKTHGHNKAYPLEEMKVNDKNIHIEDVEHGGEFTSHPFDSHPIMSNYSRSPKSHDSLQHDTYLKGHDDFHADGGGGDAYWDMVETRDPKAHEARGSVKHSGVHADIEGLNLEDVAAEPSEDKATAVSAEPELPKKAPSLADMKAKLAAIRGGK